MLKKILHGEDKWPSGKPALPAGLIICGRPGYHGPTAAPSAPCDAIIGLPAELTLTPLADRAGLSEAMLRERGQRLPDDCHARPRISIQESPNAEMPMVLPYVSDLAADDTCRP
jgi:hypothetical protein